MDDSSDLDLDVALRIDELVAEYTQEVDSDPQTTPEQFAARQDDVPTGPLLEALRGAGLLDRTTRRGSGPFAAGTRVGPYRIDGVIGRGGMGIVYEAREEELGRDVALKAMDALDTDERTRARFAREARAAASLDHSAIVPVFGSGEERGVLWYAMRRVEGDSLDIVLRDRLSPDDARKQRAIDLLVGAASSASSASSPSAASSLSPLIRGGVSIVKRLAEALAYAHAEGILHRDIKPSNVLIDAHGAPLLTDFGLCKVESDATLTAPHDVIGTLRYMPPEALEGRFGPEGDVYSLGLILYEIVSGRPAFATDSRRAILQQVLSVDPPALRESNVKAPVDLERVVAKAIAKLPEERYATAAEFAEDLDAVLAGRAVRARKSSALHLARLFVRRNRALSATVAVAMVTGLVGTALYIVQLRDAYDQVDTALGKSKENEEAARDALEIARVKESEAKEALAAATESAAHAQLAGAEATLQTNDIVRARAFLSEVDENHRDWMWSHLAARTGLGATPDTAAVSGARKAFQNQDHSLLAVIGTGGAAIFERDGLREIGRVEGNIAGGAFGGDGRDLLLVRWDPRELVHVRVDGEGVAERTVRELESGAARISTLRDTSMVFVRIGQNDVLALDWRTNEERWRRKFPVQQINELEPISADEIVIGVAGGVVYRLRYDGNEPLRVGRHTGNVNSLLVRGDDVLASGGEDGTLLIYPPLSGHGQVFLALHSAIDSMSLAIDGSNLLAVTLRDRTTAIVRPETASVERKVTGFESMSVGTGLGTRPWLVTVTAAAELAAHEPTDHDGRLELVHGIDRLSPPAFDGEGKRMATYARERVLYVQDLDDLSMAYAPVKTRDVDARPSFDPHGRFIALGRFVLDATTLDLAHEIETEYARTTFLESGSVLGVSRPLDSQARSGSAPTEVFYWTLDATDGDPTVERASIGDHTGSIVEIHAAGNRAFLAHSGGDVVCLDVPTLETLWETHVEGGEVRALALGQRGEEMFIATSDGLVQALAAEDGGVLTDRSWRVTTADAIQGLVSSMCLGPERSQLVTCTLDGRVETWDVRTGRRLGLLANKYSWLLHVARIPGSDWIAVSGRFGRVRLFGHGEQPTGAPTADADALFTVNDIADLFRAHEPMRPALMRACKQSQRFRRIDAFWEPFLNGD